ncbi:hypothetical protein [Sphingomonas faeni]|uniref:hypothetical protein n=1 Tax=Sphingomonas faeni TaxID=185950 RepID=UPI00277E5A6F|nr:hypothetical protein [Sphingomonas faeni]MDQ0839256.1 hypothetical protein [Sphingomonas faeni]
MGFGERRRTSMKQEPYVKIRNIGAMMPIALLVMSCGPADAGSERAAVRTSAPRVLDVSGVTSGMPLVEAKRRLEAKGFSISTNPGPSWTAVLRSAVDQLKTGASPKAYDQKGVTDMYARKGGEMITLGWVTPTPAGGEVNTIVYSVPLQGRSRDELRAAMRVKYGAPTRDSGNGTIAWCAAGDVCVSGESRQPMMSYEESDRANLRLDPGLQYAAAAKSRMEAAVRAVVGKPATSF